MPEADSDYLGILHDPGGIQPAAQHGLQRGKLPWCKRHPATGIHIKRGQILLSCLRGSLTIGQALRIVCKLIAAVDPAPTARDLGIRRPLKHPPAPAHSASAAANGAERS